MATKQEMLSAARSRDTVPVGKDRKTRTALSTNKIPGFVTMPSEKNK